MAKSKTQNSNFTSYLHLVAIFLFLLVSLIWYHGSKDLYFLTGDQMYIGVMVLKDVNPQFFSKDTFFRDKQFYQYYIPTFRKLIRILYEKTGDIVVSYKILVIPINFLFMLFSYIFFLNIIKEPISCIFTSIISTMVVPLPGISETYGTGAGITAVLPRNLFLVFSPLLFLILYKYLLSTKFSKKIFLNITLFAFLGILTNLHPSSGLGIFQVFILIYLLYSKFSFNSVMMILIALILQIIGTLPFLINYFHSISLSSATGYDFNFINKILMFRFKNFFYPFQSLNIFPRIIIDFITFFLLFMPLLVMFSRKIYLLSEKVMLILFFVITILMGSYLVFPKIIYVILPSFCFFILCKSSKDIENYEGLKITIYIGIIIFYLAILMPILIERVSSILAQPIILFDQNRIARYFPFVFNVYIVFLISYIIKKVNKNHRLLTLIIIGMVCIVIIGVTKKINTERHNGFINPAFFDLIQWVKKNTSLNSLFIYDDTAFRFYAQRSILVSRKDCGTAYFSSKENFVKWYFLYNKYNSAKRNFSKLVKLSKNYKGDYIIVSPPIINNYNLKKVFKNSVFEVYKVN